GCLSVPEEHQGYVVRHARVTVKGYDLLTDQNITIRARGYLAIVLQHELEHFKGVLFYDHINSKDPFAKVPGAMVI
ncbi:MAG: peptide deformylase, partial [Bulleidia sp.]